MKKSIVIILAFAALACGCNTEILPDSPMSEKTVFSVSLPSTRTVLGDESSGSRQLYWSDGDCIAVNGTASEPLSGVPAGSTNASFTVSGSLSEPYDAVYPASIWNDASSVTIPSVAQSGVLPLGGRSEDPDLSLKPLMSCLHLTIQKSSAAGADEHQIAYVEVSATGVRMNGRFAIDFADSELTPDPVASPDDCKVRVAGPWSLDSDLDLFIPVAAGSYSFQVKIVDEKGHFMTVATTSDKNMAKGVIKAFPAIAFVPTGTQFDVVITSASDLIGFAQDYNSKVYESLGSDLKVCLDRDITFDAASSADFNSTGGIGLKVAAGDAEDYYFNGLFDGQGFTISGLEATVPVFKATGDDGTVKDLGVDGTCSFTFTHPNTTEAMFGSVVGYHKGILDNVKVAADISLAAVADVAQMTTLGGLAGRTTVGKLQNGCEYSGLISTPEGFTTTGKLIIGGLVGRISNTASIDGCSFKGAISNSAQVTSTDTSNPFLIIGGVVGHLGGGGSVASSNSTADHGDQATAHSTMTGTLVNKATIAYNSATGGIVGELDNGTVSDCTNAANIALTVFKNGGSGTTGNTSARYMKTGGIAGKVNASGTVTGCTNNGAVEHRSNPRLQDLGGIAGYNAGCITSCTNTAKVNHMTTGLTGATNKGGRIVNIAGVIGENVSGSVVSDVHNTGNIQISSMEANYDTDNNKPLCEARMGGVIALNSGDIDGGSTKNITNTGQVYFNSNFALQFIGYEIGGIVGYSTASVQNAKNSGYVIFNWASDANVASKVYVGGIVGMMAGNGTIGGCINEGGEGNVGEVYPNVKAGSAGHNNVFGGGILGYSTSDVTISSCTNSGYVHGGNGTRVNGTSFYLGGIVAYLGGASKILDCTNTGRVNSAHQNNNDTIGSAALVGGLAGHIEGTDSDPIIIGGTTGCSVDASVVAVRGWVAGLIAYAKYVNLSNCLVEQDINCAARGIGGLVGKAEYCTISSSSFKGEKVHANNVQASTGQGGIVGNLSNSTVDGCSCYATTLTNNVSIATVGTIVGVSGENNTIKNCHYKATVTTTSGSVTSSIAGTGTFSGEGNTADL